MAYKMRRGISFSIGALLILFVIPLAHAAAFNDWNVDVALNNGGGADWTVRMVYKEPASRIDYWIFGDVTNVRGLVGGSTVVCTVTKPEVGSSISCPAEIVANQTVVLTFSVPSMARTSGAFQQLRYNFALTELTSRFSLKIILPKGASLAAADKLAGTGLAPFEPAYGREGTDGQRIWITWELQNPRLGETIVTTVIYEPIVVQPEAPIFLIAIAAAVIAGIVTYLFYFKRQPERLLPALMPTERTVMELVIKQRTVDQRDVVRATGFSKAKVSRIVQTLTDRRLIEAVPKGRTRELRLAQQAAIQDSLWSHIFRLKVKREVGKLALDRAQAVEVVQTSVTPLIDWLDSVLERLQRQKYGYAWDGSEFEIDERFTNPVPETLVKEITKMLPSTPARLKTYGAGIEKLGSILKRMERGIVGNGAFVSMSKKLARVKCPELEKNITYYLVRHVIDKDKVARHEYTWAPLWNSSAAALMRMAEGRIVKNLRPELARSTQSLMRTCTTFRRELEQVRDHLRREHHLLFRELRT